MLAADVTPNDSGWTKECSPSTLHMEHTREPLIGRNRK
jgi:hypothetical protein